MVNMQRSVNLPPNGNRISGVLPDLLKLEDYVVFSTDIVNDLTSEKIDPDKLIGKPRSIINSLNTVRGWFANCVDVI
jgi:hypothetical protein